MADAVDGLQGRIKSIKIKAKDDEVEKKGDVNEMRRLFSGNDYGRGNVGE